MNNIKHLFPRLKNIPFCSPIPGSAPNRDLIDVTHYRANRPHQFFFNQFITRVYHGSLADPTDKSLCEELLSRTAVVEITMTTADAIVVSKAATGSYMEFGTRIGGLLSLYSGFSALSAAELIFWLIRLVICSRG